MKYTSQKWSVQCSLSSPSLPLAKHPLQCSFFSSSESISVPEILAALLGQLLPLTWTFPAFYKVTGHAVSWDSSCIRWEGLQTSCSPLSPWLHQPVSDWWVLFFTNSGLDFQPVVKVWWAWIQCNSKVTAPVFLLHDWSNRSWNNSSVLIF